MPLSFMLISCVSQTNSSQLPDYPGYSEVIVKFLDDYSISEIEFPNQFSLAKKPDGWHAMIIDINSQQTIQDDLFWARRLRLYRKINFPPTTTNASNPEYKSIIEDWAKNYFTSILPYWGYTGWEKDIIDEYGNKKNLSDTLINALARAYVSYASNLLSNNSGFSSKKMRFSLPDGQNALSEKQLAEYREYEHKGIDSYYKLWQLNPDFETFVADIYNVYSNQVMTSYLTISYFQNHEEAQTELKDGLYDPFIRDMAKRYLASCDSNAILITNGDMDTYPLLFIQEKEGFRKDISVVNISLLNDGRYISDLIRGFSDREPVMCSLPEEFYWNNTGELFYVTDQVESSEISSVLEFVASTDQRTKLPINNKEYDYIPTKKIIMSIDNSNLPDYYQVSGNYSEILIELEGYYMRLNHFCFLDILSTNNFRRPVYFAISVGRDNYLNLEDYFLCEGMAYRITPVKRRSSDNVFKTGYIDTDIQYEKIMEIAAFQISDDTQKYYDMHNRTTRHYRMVYGRLAGKLIDEDKRDKALNVLNYCISEFSSDKVEYSYQSINLVEAYYRLNQIDEANTIVKELFQSSADYFTKNSKSLDIYEYETRLKLEIINGINPRASPGPYFPGQAPGN